MLGSLGSLTILLAFDLYRLSCGSGRGVLLGHSAQRTPLLRVWCCSQSRQEALYGAYVPEGPGADLNVSQESEVSDGISPPGW